MLKAKVLLGGTTILIFAIGAFSCSTAIAGLIDAFQVRKAKEICEEKGKFKTNGRVSTEGYLLTRSAGSGSYLFSQIANELLENRFTFFELPQKDNGGWSNKLYVRAIGDGKRFYRFYLAPMGSPACAGFVEEIGNYPAQKLPLLRALGLPVDLCIASERTDESKSKYEVNIDSNYSENLLKAQGGAYDWITRWSVRDKSNGQIVAEVSTNGYFSGGHGEGSYSCPNKDQIELFKNFLQPISDPRLAARVKWSDVDLSPFPLSLDLKASELAERQSGKRMTENEYLNHLNPVADNGNVWLHDNRLEVINQGRGIRASVQKVFGSRWLGFQYLRYENGEIFFFGQPAGAPLHSKDVAVFRYDRNVKPIAVYRIALPDISFKGDVRYLVERMSFAEGGIALTVLDVTRGRNGVGMNVLAEHELWAPLK